MIPVLTLLTVVTISIAIMRVATVALCLTGLSRESARFQARSAFTGVGFTTAESEQVVTHPVRRRILMHLMLVGNVGFVTVASSMVVALMQIEGGDRNWIYGLWLLLGLGALYLVAKSRWIDRRISRSISWALSRYTHLDVRDYSSLLHLARGYRVSELYVDEGDWLAGKRLMDLKLRSEGILVLGIERASGPYVGAPNGDTLIEPGDALLVYGRDPKLEDIDHRPQGWEGDRDHQVAMAEHRRDQEDQRREDPAEHHEQAPVP